MTQKTSNSKFQIPEKIQALSYEVRGARGEGRGFVFLLLFIALWTLDFGPWTPSVFAAPSTNAPARPDFSSFKLVTERNIFNTRRSAAYKAPDRPGPTRRAQKTESFALVGTMNDREGPLAFFEGSSSDYRKVLKHNEAIGGYKVTAIEPSFVKLASPTNEVELQIGMQLAREEEGPWKVSARPESAEPIAPRSTSSRSSYQTSNSRPGPEPTPPRNEDNPASFIERMIAPLLPELGLSPGINEPQGRPAPANSGQPAPTTSSEAENDILARLAARAAAERGGSP